MSQNAPPGGGGAPAYHSRQQPANPAPADPALDPANVPDPSANPNPAPNPDPNANPNPAPVAADPNALSLEPIEPATPAAGEHVSDYGDPALNVAADFFINTLGLAADSRELVEAGKGNFYLLEAKIEVLGDKAKGAGPMLNLAKDAMTRVQNAAKTKHGETVGAVHKAVGGEANWKAVQAWARSALPKEQLAEASAALSQGGLVAAAVAEKLLGEARKNPQVALQGAPVSDPNAPNNPLVAAGPLSREDFRSQYKELVTKYGIRGVEKSAEYKALKARGISQ